MFARLAALSLALFILRASALREASDSAICNVSHSSKTCVEVVGASCRLLESAELPLGGG